MNSAQFPEGDHWFCVRTKPKKERSAALGIHAQLGLKVFSPQIRFRRKTTQGAKWFQEAMFPGYIFVRFDMYEMKRAVAYAPGVLTLPKFNERYVPIPDSMIERIQSDLDENDSVDGGVPLEVGEKTTILEGSMRGLQVQVVKVMSAESRVTVLLEMLGTLVEAEFPMESLEQRSKKNLALDK